MKETDPLKQSSELLVMEMVKNSLAQLREGCKKILLAGVLYAVGILLICACGMIPSFSRIPAALILSGGIPLLISFFLLCRGEKEVIESETDIIAWQQSLVAVLLHVATSNPEEEDASPAS